MSHSASRRPRPASLRAGSCMLDKMFASYKIYSPEKGKGRVNAIPRAKQ